MNKKSGDILGCLCIVIFCFFITIYAVCPVIKSMWNMLVYPSYPVELKSGVIIFVMLIMPLIKYKVNDEERGFKYYITHVLSLYITILFAWMFAYLYTFFI